MSEYILYVDGGGNSNHRTYFSYKCIGPDKTKYVSMNVFYLDNLPPEILPKDCSIYDSKGNGTNNIAEYASLYFALLKFIKVIGNEKVVIKQDSELVVNQVNGTYQCKAQHLQSWLSAIKKIWWDGVSLEWVSRDEIVKILGH